MKRMNVAVCLVVLSASLAVGQRLPELAVPESYRLSFSPDFSKDNFAGDETIAIRVLKPTREIVLNAAEITFQDVTIASGGTSQVAHISSDKEKETVTLSVEQTLTPGPATIRVHYTGTLNGELRGFYLGKDEKGRKYAATQFESTDARRAFPSFDEPALKATFDITVVADKAHVAISNGKVVSDTPGPGEGKHTVRFSTTPKISSYLVALLVGEFESVDGEADGIPIRVWATPGKKQLSTFALATAQDIMKYYNHYFDIKYPFEKLDLVGLPDFAAGAMENVGCITFREVILQIDDKQASLGLHQSVALVLAHEMAHQWFGDLVTMQWWDDVWLNEGFATWMESKPIEALRPEWHYELDDVSNMTGTLGTDSLVNTRPIHQDAETPGQIAELFDGIAYGKAAAVLRMVEGYVGEENFRKGVNEYLKQHSYGNATAEDFWSTLARVTGKPVDAIMKSLVEQAGAPFVTLQTQCVAGSTQITLRQQRFRENVARSGEPGPELWQLPVCVKAAKDGGSNTEHCELLTQRNAAVKLAGCGPWVLANAGARGYYRSGYENEALDVLSGSLGQLTPAERVMLLSDSWASMRSGKATVAGLLDLVNALKQERTRVVLNQALSFVGSVDRNLVQDPDRPAFQTWLRSWLSPAANELGWEPKPGESDDVKDLRAQVLSTLGQSGEDPATLEAARGVAEKVLADPSSVDRNLAPVAMSLAAMHGDTAFYEKTLARTRDTKSQEEYYLFLGTLSRFRDPKLLQRTMAFALSEDVRTQDKLFLLGDAMNNRSGKALTWDFVRAHYAELEKLGGGFGGAQVVGMAAALCDAKSRQEFNDFFKDRKVLGGERTLKQTREEIDNCIDEKAIQAPVVSTWLQQRHAAAAGN